MQFLIIVLILFHTSTTLFAKESFERYMSMKKEAYALYEKNQKDAAYKSVHAYLKEEPKSQRAKNLLAVLHYWDGDFEISKRLLQEVLAQGAYPQAKALLTRVNEKLVNVQPLQQRVVSNNAKSTRPAKQSASNIPTDDLMLLVKKIRENPNDALSRKILSQHYAKIGNTKQALFYANQVLEINPDDVEMIAYLRSDDEIPPNLTAKKNVSKALDKLDLFYKNRAFARYINLYNALEHNGAEMDTEYHVNALQSAIELEQYERAKSIIQLYKMPKSKYLSEIEKMVDEKLLLQRFTALEQE